MHGQNHIKYVYLIKLINSIADEEAYFHTRQIILSRQGNLR